MKPLYVYHKYKVYSKKEHEDYTKYENIQINTFCQTEYKLYNNEERAGYIKYENISINRFWYNKQGPHNTWAMHTLWRKVTEHKTERIKVLSAIIFYYPCLVAKGSVL